VKKSNRWLSHIFPQDFESINVGSLPKYCCNSVIQAPRDLNRGFMQICPVNGRVRALLKRWSQSPIHKEHREIGHSINVSSLYMHCAIHNFIFESHRMKLDPEPSSPSILMKVILTRVSAEITASITLPSAFRICGDAILSVALQRGTGTTLKVRFHGVL
jgi:hypothetical protein